MAISFASLISGSNGNCYYIENEHEAILIDAGISCRETEKRINRLGLSMKKIRAIFVSHEHTDHIRGIAVIAQKYRLPVYITELTLNRSGINLDSDLVRSFTAHQSVDIGELMITPFPKLHDASEPHSFTVKCKDFTVGVFTDIGFPCEQVIRYFSQCHAAFLESNYDEDLLESGRYPYHLKSRIRGLNGHLSNKQAFDLFAENGTHMSHLLLSHLSRDNNDPGLVVELFGQIECKTKITVASRDHESEIFHISDSEKPLLKSKLETIQFSLF
jgi:phosphoribosyl 1,2-cyclic phosphodiesterase